MNWIDDKGICHFYMIILYGQFMILFQKVKDLD